MRDTVKTGIAAGLLGSIGDDVVHWISYVLIGTSTTAHYISELVFPFKNPTIARLLTGEAIHYISGAMIGIFLLMIFRYFGFDSPYYKGLGLGGIMWIIHVAIIPNIVSPRPYILRSELESFIDFLAHMVFGILATVYLLRTAVRKSLNIKPE